MGYKARDSQRTEAKRSPEVEEGEPRIIVGQQPREAAFRVEQSGGLCESYPGTWIRSEYVQNTHCPKASFREM